MKVLARILALFLILPVVELALLVQVDKLIGFWPTIGLILVTGLVGSFLARREGLSVWRQFNQRMAKGGLPGKELIDGVIILLAGALLITPGVLTDVIGFLGLLPPTRAPIRKIALKRIQRAMERSTLHVVRQEGWTAGAYHGMEPDTQGQTRWQGAAANTPRHADDEDPRLDV